LGDKTCDGYLDWYACLVATPGGARWFNDIARLVKPMAWVADDRVRKADLIDATLLPAYQTHNEDI
jgi:hypothetical protein